ncbi:MAG: trigger factor [Betaproteobacteria bacterium]|nr:trigger factor [Betaproteobacteria bacterium]
MKTCRIINLVQCEQHTTHCCSGSSAITFKLQITFRRYVRSTGHAEFLLLRDLCKSLGNQVRQNLASGVTAIHRFDHLHGHFARPKALHLGGACHLLELGHRCWVEVDRAPANGDQVTIDFRGTLDGVAFEGGSAEGFSVVLGEGRMLPDFEKGLLGQAKDHDLHFPVQFPENYGAEQLAGKLASFEAKIHRVEEPLLPPVDAAFAQQLGVPDGDLEKLRAEIRKNLEREVGQRVKARIKAAVMESLPKVSSFDLPKALVETEVDALAERAKQDLAQRGIDVKQMPIPREAFEESAKKRVQLGLIVSELVKQEKLQPKPEQVRAIVEEAAAAYENPAEVVRYYFSDRQRLAEVEALAVEQNVVDYVLQHAKVSDKDLAFDELMQQAA